MGWQGFHARATPMQTSRDAKTHPLQSEDQPSSKRSQNVVNQDNEFAQEPKAHYCHV